jgi:hypothetical protein
VDARPPCANEKNVCPAETSKEDREIDVAAVTNEMRVNRIHFD